MKKIKGKNGWGFKSILMISGLIFCVLTINTWADEDTDKLRQEIKDLKEQMDGINKRLNKAEIHTVTDKLSLGIELRTRADSIHYYDIKTAPGMLMNRFFDPFIGQANFNTMNQMAPMMTAMGITTDQFLGMMQDPQILQNMLNDPATQGAMQTMMTNMNMTPNQMGAMFTAANSLAVTGVNNAGMGFNGATLDQARAMMGMMKNNGIVPAAVEHDATNDVAFTTKFRLEMKAKVNADLSFMGRLAAYKAWGDSTGVKFNNGSMSDVTFDGNTSSLPHGDTMRLERAFFNFHKYVSDVAINFSLGRRPSTEGPPYEYRHNSMEAGSPLTSIINWQFDGASLNFGLEDLTNIPGLAVKLCYGVGFEGGWGNTYSLNSNPAVDDVHLAGVITTLFDNDLTSVVLNYAHAWDITDGFTGLTVMPFIISKDLESGTYNFAPNNGGFITRMQPSTELGDWDAASLLIRSNLEEMLADIDVFMATSWSHTDPRRISQNPFYEIMGQGLLSSDNELESHCGYSLYAGVLFPMPFEGRVGLEYNWGSRYWFNFTGAEDSLVGSKLAARGQVMEAYYIQPIYKHNFFLKIGGQYYDYEYTGSGNPMGKPVKIADANSFDSLNAVIDKVWDVYLSLTMRF